MPHPIFWQISFFYSYLFNIFKARIDLYYNQPTPSPPVPERAGERLGRAGVIQAGLPDKFYGGDVTSIEDQA